MDVLSILYVLYLELETTFHAYGMPLPELRERVKLDNGYEVPSKLKSFKFMFELLGATILLS